MVGSRGSNSCLMSWLVFAFTVFGANPIQGDWDIAVATGNGVELLMGNSQSPSMSVMGGIGAPGLATYSLAFDPLRGHLFFTDATHPNVSIFRISLSSSGEAVDHQRPQPIVKKSSKEIDGLAYDTVKNIIYWTVAREKKIMRADLIMALPKHGLKFRNKAGREGDLKMEVKKEWAEESVHHQFEKEIPRGIAVDPCRRYLYWTNMYVLSPTIERSHLDDGKGRSVVVSSNLRFPVALALSLTESALYWLDTSGSDGSYRIEKSDLNGQGRRVVVESGYQRPFSLAVAPHVSSVYWTDWTGRSIWRIKMEGDFSQSSSPFLTNPSTPELVKKYKDNTPRGIVSLTQDSFNVKQCKGILVTLKNELSVGTTSWDGCRAGEKSVNGECMDWACLNYCLSDKAECSLNPIGNPSCKCPPTRVGNRCQFPHSLCPFLCTLDSSTYNDTCRCSYNTAQLSFKELHLETWKRVSMGLAGAVILLLLGFSAFLIKLKLNNQKPRAKRRYKVNPPLRTASDHCEIAIENCCNMNICETPCYEPDFPVVSTSNNSKKKEEKKKLLKNIEVNCTEDLY